MWLYKNDSRKCIFLLVIISIFGIIAVLYKSNNRTSGISHDVIRDPLANMTGDLSFNKLHYEHLKRRLPGCIVIGVRKAGTRAVLKFLKLHPDIVATGEEVHFFDREENFVNGLEWYRNQMPYSLPDQITMEKTPGYFHESVAAQRLHNMNSSLRLILIVRDPVKRAISDWHQLDMKRVRNGKDPIPFEKLALRSDGSINTNYDVLQRSIYSMHYKRWTKIFSPRQIHIVHGEAFMRNPSKELEKVESFLKIARYLTPDLFRFNQTKGFYCAVAAGCLDGNKGRIHPDITPDLLLKLKQYYKKFNGRFYRAVEQDFDWEEDSADYIDYMDDD